MNFRCKNISESLFNSSVLRCEFEKCTRMLKHNNYTTIYVFLVINGLAIVVANILVFFLFKQNSFLRKKQNFLLVSLAASDLLAGTLTVPLIILCQNHSGVEFCVAMDTCTRFLAVSTLLHLLTATIERFVKIVKPFHYNVYVTECRSMTALAAVWSLSFATAIIQLFWIDLDASEEKQQQLKQVELVYSSACLVLFVLFPFICITVLHSLLLNAIWKGEKTLRLLSMPKRSRKRSKRKEKERKAAVVLMTMTGTYFVGWFPYFFMSVVNDVYNGAVVIPLWLNVLLLFLKLNTALINPLLYTFFKTDFTTALKITIQKYKNRKFPTFFINKKLSTSLKRKRKKFTTKETELKTVCRKDI